MFLLCDSICVDEASNSAAPDALHEVPAILAAGWLQCKISAALHQPATGCRFNSPPCIYDEEALEPESGTPFIFKSFSMHAASVRDLYRAAPYRLRLHHIKNFLADLAQ
jgi:hypothetical protein